MGLAQQIRVQAASVAVMTPGDQEAILKGYIRVVSIEGGCQGGDFLIEPDTDLDTRFRAWGLDWQEWAWVNGWACEIEDLSNG